MLELAEQIEEAASEVGAFVLEPDDCMDDPWVAKGLRTRDIYVENGMFARTNGRALYVVRFPEIPVRLVNKVMKAKKVFALMYFRKGRPNTWIMCCYDSWHPHSYGDYLCLGSFEIGLNRFFKRADYHTFLFTVRQSVMNIYPGSIANRASPLAYVCSECGGRTFEP